MIDGQGVKILAVAGVEDEFEGCAGGSSDELSVALSRRLAIPVTYYSIYHPMIFFLPSPNT